MSMRWTLAVAAMAAFLCAPGRAVAQAGPAPDLETIADLDVDFDMDDAADQEPDDDADEQEEAEGREQDAYDEGTDAIDEEEWARAVRQFDRVIAMKGK